MSTTGLDVFDKTLQTTNTWLGEVMERIGADRQAAWHALGAVLRTVRDRIPLELAVHLGAQLPLLVRGTYYDQWHPSAQPERSRTLQAFLARVEAGLNGTPQLDAREAARAVFYTVTHHVDPGQVAKVVEALPEEVRALWHDSAAVAS
ncbi:MAG TPA: DUF2267 domain-containing protein [Roseomonas sp.]|nr:DUF2267 domain-containing protein [Roseomonas sp.]